MRSSALIPAACFCTLVLSSFTCTAGEDKVYKLTKKELVIEGMLKQEDPKVKISLGPNNVATVPARSFVVSLSAGKTYRVSLKSEKIDSVLAVMDMGGKQLAFDDGAGGVNADSLLVFVPPADGLYKVYAGSLAGSGNFTLHLAEQMGVGGTSVLNSEGQIDERTPKITVVFPPNYLPAGVSAELQAKVFPLKLSAGKTYRIAMNSTEVDSVVVVQDMAGKQLAFDDDGGGYPNSLLFFTPDKSDTYNICAAALKAGAFAKGVGKFTVQVTDEGFGKRIAPGKVHEVGARLRIDGRLDQFAKSIPYQVKLVQGKTYIVEMHSPLTERLNPILYVKDMTGKVLAQNDSLGKVNALILYVPQATSTYQLEATSYMAKGVGLFTLSVRDLAKGIAAAIDSGALITKGSLVQEDPRDELLTKSPCKVYSVRMRAGKNYTIDLSSADFDSFLRLEDSTGNQLAFDDDGGSGKNARISFDPVRDDDYRIIVTSLDKRSGEYALSIRQK